jgi:hypothetical protein
MLSFVHLLRGEFDPALVAGRKVLVGAVAIELGDWISVPRYPRCPGRWFRRSPSRPWRKGARCVPSRAGRWRSARRC